MNVRQTFSLSSSQDDRLTDCRTIIGGFGLEAREKESRQRQTEVCRTSHLRIAGRVVFRTWLVVLVLHGTNILAQDDAKQLAARFAAFQASELVEEGSSESLRKALEKYGQALEIYQALRDRTGEAKITYEISKTHRALGDFSAALPLSERALSTYQSLQDSVGEAVLLNDLGRIQVGLENKQKALDLFERSLTLSRAIKHAAGEGTNLFDIATLYDKMGKGRKALEYYHQGLPIFRALGDRSNEANTLQSIGLVYWSLGEKQQALEAYEQQLVLDNALGNQRSESITLRRIGDAYDALGEKKKALDSYQSSLKLSETIEDRLGQAVCLNSIGQVLVDLGEMQQALSYFEKALPLRKMVGDRRGEATTIADMGNVYDSLGNNSEALEYYNDSLAIAKELEDRDLQASILNSLGGLYHKRGEEQAALNYLEQALALRKVAPDRAAEAGILNNLGGVFDHLGERQKALEYYGQSLTITKSLGDRAAQATVLSNIGNIYQTLNNPQKALQYYLEALPLSKAVGDRTGEGTALNNIGSIYSLLGDPNKALNYFNQALSLLRQVGDRGGEAKILNNLGGLYSDLGQPQKALECYMQSLETRRAVGDRAGQGIMLNNISLIYYELGDNQEALAYLNQALPVVQSVNDPSLEAKLFGNLMFHWQTSNVPLAIFYGKQAVNGIQRLRSAISGLEKDLQKSFLRSHEERYRLLADLLISSGRLPEAQQVLAMLKEEEYFEFVRRSDSESALSGVSTLSPEEAAIDKRYREIADRVAAIGSEYGRLRAQQTRTVEEEQRLTKLEADLTVANQAFQKFLDELDQSFSTNSGQSEKAFALRESQGLMQTLGELGNGTVAIYTVVGEEKLRVILVTADVQKAYTTVIKASDLNRKVLQFRQAIQNPRLDPRPLGQELYKLLVGPELARDLEQAKAQTLMWSLDGTLRYLPIAALYDGEKYFVQKYRNVVFTPASQSRLKDKVSAKWRALGFGVSKAQAGFNPLPGVPEELQGIIRPESVKSTGRNGLLDGQILLDEAFTVTAMQNALRQRYPLVHIASHFSFKPGNETDSFLLLGDGSHLSLAQIKSMPNVFSGIDLLTLSACDTASGSAGASGKEVEGFAVLAQRQGAKAVLATLWPVADESTQLLMREFYRLREANRDWPKVESLRQAQLELLTANANPESNSKTARAEILAADSSTNPSGQPSFTPDPKAPYAHPYFWAPFILIGNWQ